MSSIRRIQASRANGRLSRGPVTARGKGNTSRNALRHGFFAKSVSPSDESSAGFRELYEQYVARFSPSSPVERSLLYEMTAASWRLRRVWALEKQVLNDALAAQPSGDETARFVGAFKSLASGPQLDLIHRYETRIQGLYQRALRKFLQLRHPGMRNKPTK
jgi:hypothetical protein